MVAVSNNRMLKGFLKLSLGFQHLSMGITSVICSFGSLNVRKKKITQLEICMFLARLASLRGDAECLARSPDLSMCDFFLWF